MKKKNYFSKITGMGKSILLIVALAITSLVFAQPDLNLGLKLHYTFEQATGTTVPDVTGNGYDGTLYGATVGLSNGKNSSVSTTKSSYSKLIKIPKKKYADVTPFYGKYNYPVFTFYGLS